MIAAFLLSLMTLSGTDLYPSDTTSLKVNGGNCSHLGNTDLIFEIVECMTEFPGGQMAMINFCQKP